MADYVQLGQAEVDMDTAMLSPPPAATGAAPADTSPGLFKWILALTAAGVATNYLSSKIRRK